MLFGEHALIRYGRSIPKLDDFQRLRKELGIKNEACKSTMQLFRTDVYKQKYDIMNEQWKDLRVNTGKKEKVLQFFSTIQYGADHDFARRKLGNRYAGCGLWLLFHSDY